MFVPICPRLRIRSLRLSTSANPSPLLPKLEPLLNFGATVFAYARDRSPCAASIIGSRYVLGPAYGLRAAVPSRLPSMKPENTLFACPVIGLPIASCMPAIPCVCAPVGPCVRLNDGAW